MITIKPLTPIQKEHLLVAIQKAQAQGQCKYHNNYYGKVEPRCVIGQLGYIYNCPISNWEGNNINSVFNDALCIPDLGGLKDYPLELLQLLQWIWDKGKVFSVDDYFEWAKDSCFNCTWEVVQDFTRYDEETRELLCRKAMVNLVENWPVKG